MSFIHKIWNCGAKKTFSPQRDTAVLGNTAEVDVWQRTDEAFRISRNLRYIYAASGTPARLLEQIYQQLNTRQKGLLSDGLKSLIEWKNTAVRGDSNPSVIIKTTQRIYQDLAGAGLYGKRWCSKLGDLSQTISAYIEKTKVEACVAFAKKSFASQLVRGWFDQTSLDSISSALSLAKAGKAVLDTRLTDVQINALWDTGISLGLEEGAVKAGMFEAVVQESRRNIGRILGRNGTISSKNLKSEQFRSTTIITTEMLNTIDVHKITDLEHAHFEYKSDSGQRETIQVIGLVKGDVALQGSDGRLQVPLSTAKGFVIVYSADRGDYSAIDPDMLVAGVAKRGPIKIKVLDIEELLYAPEKAQRKTLQAAASRPAAKSKQGNPALALA